MIIKKTPPPPFRFLFSHPAHFVACGLGSGLSFFAPGTAGTAFAWATYPLLRLAYPADANFALFLALMFAFGIWCCQVTGRHLGMADHGSIVWDEIVPFWAVLMFVPPALAESPHGIYLSLSGAAWQTAAFLLFRFYDIVKPPPADWFDRRFKNGFGVMMDDAAAAAWTVLTLALAKALLERLH
ncbi:MAG: phosphatidylglycerophosphatase A [Candidatus Nitricoxidivorans perseverans]|uniref:Phosphatidylglycerophosphatase A n=1 Tax=Candidatus Nitricoxidivorans perseverans TaxID=2975601 RepID=A0AA49FJK3_9PROT|nr:MAG: phosphatidylglycerophosphatase A [Candidatus Nitricoxidivorans perseverans]